VSFEKVQIGSATLYCGDSREIVPTLAFDDVITDPPYGIEEMVGGYGRSGRTIANDTNLDVCTDVLRLCAETMTDGWIAAFYSCRVSPEFFRRLDAIRNPETGDPTYYGEIMWDKKAPGMGNPIRYQHENIAIYRVGDPDPIGATFSIVRDYRMAKGHPHQKPEGIMLHLAKVIGTGIALDPFMGSGSTGVACAMAVRPFIGIELDPAYFELACQRVEAAMSQASVFAAAFAPPPPAEQSGLFA
jgi:DNA modification methylase